MFVLSTSGVAHSETLRNLKTKQDYSRGVIRLVLVVVPENMKSISAGEASKCCPVYFRENADDIMAKH